MNREGLEQFRQALCEAMHFIDTQADTPGDTGLEKMLEGINKLCDLAVKGLAVPEAATQFDAVGWWDGEKALFEPNQIPVRGALLFRPRPSALNPKAAWPFPEKRIEPQGEPRK